MRRPSQSDSETDENSEKSSSNEEENASNHGEQQEEVISEYEKQRFERIKENKARLEALRLPSLASSLLGSIEKKGKRKEKKKKGKQEDEEYKPSDGEERATSSSNEEVEGEEEDESEDASNSKGKSRQSSHKSKSKTKRYVQKRRRKVDFIDDDEALQQAIALSLEDSSEVSGALLHSLHNSRADVTAVELEERKRRPLVQEIDKRKKKRQLNTSRVQITEDQATIHFFQFDEAGKGGITVNDLRRVAIDHDFMWSDKEIYDMVDLFDSDGDGKLHFDDFQKILHRCNMIKG